MITLPIKQIARISGLIVSSVIGLVGALFLFALAPLEGNYKWLVVESGSMSETVPQGSLIMVQPQAEYRSGDIVTFAPSIKEKDKYVTHRIVGFAQDRFGLLYQTKGDANNTVDPGTLPVEQIVGKVIFTLPFVGTIFHLSKTPLGFILLVIVPATIMIYEETKKVYQGLKEGFQNHFLNKKRLLKLNRQDKSLLEDIEKLRQQNQKLNQLLTLIFLVFGVSFSMTGLTYGFLSDMEVGEASLTAFAETSVPSPSASPIPHIVINEVFYDVDSTHGLDSPGDRGVTVGGHVTQVRIAGNSAGSQNSAFVDIESLCSVVQTNQTDVEINIEMQGDTGGNSAFGNLLQGTIESGDVSQAVVIDIEGGSNTLSDFCSGGRGRNHEWVELYNPTSDTVNLKNWTLTDNSGISVKITGNRYLKPGQFALVSKSNSTWSFWDEGSDALKIPLGRQIGDGLDDAGDRLYLKDETGAVVDALSYGDDTSVFSLSGGVEGTSLEREPDGLDTDAAADWIIKNPPNPGS